ncbi:probable receptor-like protein kinase At4g10390 [Ananas comosus]|uniref:Probable receptor-like protein kinase At4g10390 n=1 Tax=Ananas comosus TaxID=4615 RepID=A0A199V127_ANACO|nr:probable receptor-like protein kinase At4g10390 [Ananas comosus]OAY70590.1 putative receptor-like protein kinase [Ananas comosus]
MLRRYLCCGAGFGDGDGRVADEPELECEKVDGGGDIVRQFSWSEIESVTSGFTSPVIGEGGFSTVYLGRLPGSPSPSAVKVHFSSERLHIAFRRELDVLLRLPRHPNVVRLIGFSDDQEEGALVFEYAPNGNLHDKLHGGGGRILGWAERVSIARQVAGALDHLHERCGDLPVVHGDVKSANVVLGAGHEARLCDFGSAQLGFAAAVARPARAAVVGSPGYVDPHYLRSGLLTKGSDAYSFGVLLLELLTGAEAFSAGGPLTAAIGTKLRRSAGGGGGGIGDLVDPRLGAEYDAEEAAEMVKLAAACVAGTPSLRPSMAEVVRAMEEKACKSISAVRPRSNGKCDS